MSFLCWFGWGLLVVVLQFMLWAFVIQQLGEVKSRRTGYLWGCSCVVPFLPLVVLFGYMIRDTIGVINKLEKE